MGVAQVWSRHDVRSRDFGFVSFHFVCMHMTSNDGIVPGGAKRAKKLLAARLVKLLYTMNMCERAQIQVKWERQMYKVRLLFYEFSSSVYIFPFPSFISSATVFFLATSKF